MSREIGGTSAWRRRVALLGVGAEGGDEEALAVDARHFVRGCPAEHLAERELATTAASTRSAPLIAHVRSIRSGSIAELATPGSA